MPIRQTLHQSFTAPPTPSVHRIAATPYAGRVSSRGGPVPRSIALPVKASQNRGSFGQPLIWNVDAVAWSVMAGCDFSDKEYRENIPAAVREGKLSEVRLNDAVSRV